MFFCLFADYNIHNAKYEINERLKEKNTLAAINQGKRAHYFLRLIFVFPSFIHFCDHIRSENPFVECGKVTLNSHSNRQAFIKSLHLNNWKENEETTLVSQHRDR